MKGNTRDQPSNLRIETGVRESETLAIRTSGGDYTNSRIVCLCSSAHARQNFAELDAESLSISIPDDVIAFAGRPL